jgi:hypothetical protein
MKLNCLRPNHYDVASDFLQDSRDYLKRFSVCDREEVYSFRMMKSSRMKMFVDLRMSIESSLKGIVCIVCHSDLCGEELVKKVESYSHHIDKLLIAAEDAKVDCGSVKVHSFLRELSSLPIGLRYRLDSADFIRNREQEYYSTVGSDNWLDNAHTVSTFLVAMLSDLLAPADKIVNITELGLRILVPKYEKYKRKSSAKKL